jgi:hypothetical protein
VTYIINEIAEEGLHGRRSPTSASIKRSVVLQMHIAWSSPPLVIIKCHEGPVISGSILASAFPGTVKGGDDLIPAAGLGAVLVLEL